MGGLAIRKRAARPAQRPPLTAPVRGASARAGRDEGTAAVGIIRSPVRASILPDYIRVKCGKSQVEQIFSACPKEPSSMHAPPLRLPPWQTAVLECDRGEGRGDCRGFDCGFERDAGAATAYSSWSRAAPSRCRVRRRACRVTASP
jgi:hypothetical protein